ncbi:MAG: proline--tRNA ligase [Thermoproteota archaeon]|nr:proline--tRNA ligase [Candidatus Brockarchaeota archaeon]MBO3768178.1 proline--tRNA ligase [Candidatus Brockarchaeota archaeon]MBO3801304.1 proline--tRNA ligase [Candidatus Brockarchaeota archaeon]
MQGSKITFNIDKKQNFREWYNEIIRKAELIDDRYNIKGLIVYRPRAMKVVKEIYKLLEYELEKKDHEPVLFPLLIPEENFQKEAEHVEGFKAETFWVTMGGDEFLNEKMALRPTSETAFYFMYSLWIRGFSDLPLKLYQSVSVYRHETKATRPLIRGREFLWIEAHDAFASKEEALNQVKNDEEVTKKVLEDSLGLPVFFFRRPQWDKFKGAVDTYAADVIMPDGACLQVASTHYLGENFSRAFNVMFTDKDGKRKFVHQTCYGPGVSRILAALISVHGDNSGLIFPFNVAPIQIVIIPIPGEGVAEYSRRILEKLKQFNFKAFLDDSEDTPGEKFYKWEFFGAPLRIEVGPKEVKESKVTLVDRLTKKKETIELDKLIEYINNFSLNQIKRLRDRAKEAAEHFIDHAGSIQEVKEKIEKGKKVIKVPFCSLEIDGANCAEVIENETNLKVRGELLGEKQPTDEKCIVCGKSANHYVYLAEAY